MSKKVTDKLGREIKVGDIIAWPIASNSGTLHFALIREVLNKKNYWDKSVLTKIITQRETWDTKNKQYIKHPKKVMNYYVYFPERGIVVTEQLLSNPPEDENIQMLLKAREELLSD